MARYTKPYIPDLNSPPLSVENDHGLGYSIVEAPIHPSDEVKNFLILSQIVEVVEVGVKSRIYIQQETGKEKELGTLA